MQNGIEHIALENQGNPEQDLVDNSGNAQIKETVQKIGPDIPMVLPHIYHNAKDEQEIRRWATQIQQKLQVLIDAESRNNGIEIMLALEAVFRTSHPNAKSGLLEPNLTAEQEDDPIEGSLG